MPAMSKRAVILCAHVSLLILQSQLAGHHDRLQPHPTPTIRWDGLYRAASPPGLRLETLGLPSLSVPPDIVNPRVLPSFLISSTMVTPLNSSGNEKQQQVSSLPS